MKTGLHALKEDTTISAVMPLREVFFVDAMNAVHKLQLSVSFRNQMHLTRRRDERNCSCFSSCFLTQTLMETDWIGQLRYLHFHRLALVASSRTAHECRPHTLCLQGRQILVVLFLSANMCSIEQITLSAMYNLKFQFLCHPSFIYL